MSDVVQRQRRRAAVTPATHAAAGAAGWKEEVGAATPHANPVQGPRVQVMHGALGGAALLLQAPRGAPSTSASGGRCAPAHAVWAGGPVRALPPPPEGGGGGQRQQQWGGGLIGLGRRASTHRALGALGRHLTLGA